jgi:GTP cyclohydrolase II
MLYSKNKSTASNDNSILDLPLETDTLFDTKSITFIAKTNVPSIFGQFIVYGFLEKLTGKEHIAIVSNKIDTNTQVNLRIHSECWTGDVMGSLKCDCRAQLEDALNYVGQNGGLVIYLRQEGRGIGLLNKLKAYTLQEQGLDTVEANHKLGFVDDLRTYESAVEILRFLNITNVCLLTNNPNKIKALEDSDIKVHRKAHQLESNPYNINYLKTKANKCGHMLNFIEKLTV